MLILGIETATRQVSCALRGDDGVLGSFTASRQQQHTETLVPAVQFVTRFASVGLADLEVIAVGLGPGLFTGLRVGISTAQAMAQALDIPVVGIPTLDVVAHPLRVAQRPVLVAMDARRSELFWACFQPGPDGTLLRCSPDRVDAPARVASAAAALGPEALVVGDGPLRYPGIFGDIPPERLVRGQAALPSAVALVELVAERLEASRGRPEADDPLTGGPPLDAGVPGGQCACGSDGHVGDAHGHSHGQLYTGERVRPIYVRAPDAEAHWVERSGVVGRAR